MRRRGLMFGLLGLALYLVFLVAMAPAAWVSWAVVRASHGVVNIDRPAGTLWQGHGHLVIHLASSAPQSLGLVSWEIRPLWIFAGQLRARTGLQGPGTDVRADLGVGYRRYFLADVAATFPAQILGSLYSPAALLGPAGAFHIAARRLDLAGSNLTGNATVEWRQAASSLSSVRPLGDYRLYLQGHGRNVALRVQTLDGSLGINGSGTWEPASGQIRFGGTAKPAANQAALEPVLRMFGPDRGNGMRMIDWQWNTGPMALHHVSARMYSAFCRGAGRDGKRGA